MESLLGPLGDCPICLQELHYPYKTSPFLCILSGDGPIKKRHYFHPSCLFKSLVASGRPPSCPICRAEPSTKLDSLERFHSFIQIWGERLLFNRLESGEDPDGPREGFLVVGPYPYTSQDFGHGSLTQTTFLPQPDGNDWPLVAWHYVPEGLFGRKVIGRGSLIYFQGKAYDLKADGSVEGLLTEPRSNDGRITLARG